MRRLQVEQGTTPTFPDRRSRIGFAFSSKDRVHFTLPTLSSVDTEEGFDLVWVDGSVTPEGRKLPQGMRLKNARLVEVHSGVGGGPDRAICFGLNRLLDLGYDYCGLIENDMVFEPGWFGKLLQLFERAASDGIACGAATVRSYQSRVLEYRRGYLLCWNIGAGMVLFSRPAAQLILGYYEVLRRWMTARAVYKFYGETFGVDLRGLWDLWYGAFDHRLAMDWGYSPLLYEHGFASVGCIPSLVQDLEFDVGAVLRTRPVSAREDDAGCVLPRISAARLAWMKRTNPFFRWGWRLLNNSPFLYRSVRSMHRFQTRRLRQTVPLSLSPRVPPSFPTG